MANEKAIKLLHLLKETNTRETNECVNGDLIRRDKAEEVVAWWMRIDAEGEYSLEEVKDWPFAKHARNLLSKVPSVDAEPVRHGKWEERHIDDADIFFKRRFYCDQCGNWNTFGKCDFCPCCGADMRGDDYGRKAGD